jgi:hypothetical protein
MGEGHGRREELGSTVQESPGVKETTCIESAVRNWRNPPLHNGKKKSCKIAAYKPEGEVVSWQEGDRRSP